MATITVTPETFEIVEFDAAIIAALATELAAAIGLDAEILIDIDETTMAARVETAAEPGRVVVRVGGGALESPRRLRLFDPDRTRTVLGLNLIRAGDRLDPSFGDPPVDDELSVELDTAWTTYAEGRLARLGVPARPDRRHYHFRVRHGFTDASDRAFEMLWHADGLTWRDIEAASDAAQTGSTESAA